MANQRHEEDEASNHSNEHDDISVDQVEDDYLDHRRASDADQHPDQDNDNTEQPKKKRKVHKLSLTATQNFNEQLKKRGVIYIARVPPRMTPTKLKSLLQDFGTVTRVYLVPEDAARRKRRKQNGGNGSKRYSEGWIEFESKKTAKHVAASLNNTAISNRKRDPHCDDTWNLKFLSKFQWAHLTEKVAYERRVREQKLRLETMQARKETSAYKYAVETGKKIDKIAERKRKRGEKMDSADADKKKMRPRQVQPVDDRAVKSSKRGLLGALV
jgi:ESF2/ABP1 family protein